MKPHLEEGDLVRIKAKGSRYDGKTGELIGITHNRTKRGKGFFFTVKFSDTESELFKGRELVYLGDQDHSTGQK